MVLPQDISIRPATLGDAAELCALYAPYVTHTAITFEYDVPSASEFEARMASIMKRYPYLVLQDAAGALKGYAYASTFKERAAYDWAVELTIYLDASVQGRGLGTALYDALEDALAHQGITNLYACIGVPAGSVLAGGTLNPHAGDPYVDLTSVQFHAQRGFDVTGMYHSCGYKFERWYDMVWMEKHIAAHTVPAPKLTGPRDTH